MVLFLFFMELLYVSLHFIHLIMNLFNGYLLLVEFIVEGLDFFLILIYYLEMGVRLEIVIMIYRKIVLVLEGLFFMIYRFCLMIYSLSFYNTYIYIYTTTNIKYNRLSSINNKLPKHLNRITLQISIYI